MRGEDRVSETANEGVNRLECILDRFVGCILPASRSLSCKMISSFRVGFLEIRRIDPAGAK